jgi:uncharacterized protein (DUF488 family)
VSAFDLFSIGHSNVTAERFMAMLHDAGVTAVADVRSVPASRRFPWFAKKNLEARLASEGITYTAMGDALGGRPGNERLYRDGVADYEAMAKEPQFQAGLDRLVDAASRSRLCIMCAEREPLDCHRCLLVARSLDGRGLAVGHILHDGTIEAHATTERRLLALYGESCDLFASGQRDPVAAAYRRRAQAAAFRQKGLALHATAEMDR